MIHVINLLVIAFVVVYVIDLSGFIQDGIEPMLAKFFHVHQVRLKKPWSCSRCMTLWIGLLYILITGHFTILAAGFVFMLSYAAPVINNLEIAILDWLTKLTSSI